tara:strand:- start:245 stop:769 length:525 start_codon:yes stop_codon:yes gene_type:complete
MVKKLLTASLIGITSIIVNVSTSQSAPIDEMLPQDAIECIAKNIYFEARNESFAGQVSVGLVVLNRVNDSRFPSDVCGVVYQGRYGTNTKTSKINQCQFSWTCDGKSDNPKNQDKWFQAQRSAVMVYKMYKNGYDITDGATHYHASYVNPAWSRDATMQKKGNVDTHIFYKWGI